MISLKPQALVLYRAKAARVLEVGEKIEIETLDGDRLRVRDKDIVLLHPGPLSSLAALREPPTLDEGDLEVALGLVGEEGISLMDLARLVLSDPDPVRVWALWRWAQERFAGTPECLVPLGETELKRRAEALVARQERARQYQGAIERFRANTYQAGDEGLLAEVEALALGKQERCRVLKDLGRKETPESAHQFLLQLGYWDSSRDPWPHRLGVPLGDNPASLGEPGNLPRRDLRDLPAWAIDDADNLDPDDALSAEGDTLWVHIADPAERVPPDSEVDQEARRRGATLYLPWTTVPMLPSQLVNERGLGLAETSPALTVEIRLDPEGGVSSCQVYPSWVRVRRLSYEEAEPLWTTEPSLARIRELLRRAQLRRLGQGAVRIQLPEVKVLWRDGRVEIRPLPPNQSRELVAEAMILAGAAVAEWAEAENLPLVFAGQEAPEQPLGGEGLAGAWATRRVMKRAFYTIRPVSHFGLGLAAYAQVTSPLRRYLDLVCHQQIRLRLAGQRTLNPRELEQRISTVEEPMTLNRRCERASRTHFTLLWHLQNPQRVLDAVVVDSDRTSAVVVVPSTAEEYRLGAPDLRLNQEIQIQIRNVSLAYQTAVPSVVVAPQGGDRSLDGAQEGR